METQGRIIAIHNGQVDVRLEVATACSACKSKDGCSGGVERTITLDAPAHAHPGDLVTLTMPTAQLHLGGLLGYLFPAAATLVGAVIAAPGGDVQSALGAGLGLLTGLLGVRLLTRLWHPQGGLPVSCSSAHTPDHPGP